MKSIYLFAAILLPGLLMAQTPEKNKEVEQIVITKKGTEAQKLNIVVDGDKITVNGKPINDEKDGEITVQRRKIKDLDVFQDDWAGPGERRIIRRQLAIPPTPNRAMLGVVTQKTDKGAEVTNVTEGSAAEIAGLKPGDVILEVDREKITTPDDLSKVIKDKNPGDTVTVVFIRDKKQLTAVAELKKWEAPENFYMPDFRDFNIEEFRGRMDGFPGQGNRQFRAFTIPQGDNQKLGIKIQDVETGRGVKVIEVEKGSDADKAGIREGDIITEVDGSAVSGTDDMRLKAITARTKQNMAIKLDRNGKQQTIDLKITRKIKTADL